MYENFIFQNGLIVSYYFLEKMGLLVVYQDGNGKCVKIEDSGGENGKV